MKKNWLNFFLCILLFSHCNSRVKSITLNYNKYDYNNALLKKNAATETFKSLNNGEIQLTIIGQDEYKKTLIMKEISGRIYWKCDNKFMLSHSIYAFDKTGSCFSYPPFLNRRVTLNGERVYIIERNSYKVYSFGESTGSESNIETYYIEGIGFFCYYDVGLKNYFFLSNITGNNKVNEYSLQILKDKLIHDTSFFARYLFLDTLKAKFPIQGSVSKQLFFYK